MQNNEPVLSFEFARSDGKIKPLTFKQPLKIIATNTIEEVIPCLQSVQKEVEAGFYAAGFVSYESSPAFDSHYKVHPDQTMPLVWFGIFSKPNPEELTSNESYSLSEWEPTVSVKDYHSAISTIKDEIENGNTYQTNYTIRLLAQFHGDSLSFYNKLKRAQSSNYCAYIHTGEHSILSASPELFFHWEGKTITTRPMKGTAKRGKTYVEDTRLANWLYHSEKNRAENVMIVDLLRNDLNRIAKPGTVSVKSLFEIEKYPTVHQMTSTITAEVDEQTTIVDVFKGLFPCGSITGAPKISTMDLIAQLENSPRDVYCGAIGFITPNNEAIFNVPIRTVLIDHSTNNATYGAGGGITWDSTAVGEYEEVLAKAELLKEERPAFELLESLLLDNGEFFLLQEHLLRIGKSAEYFGFTYSQDEVKSQLLRFAAINQENKLKVRLLLTKNGEVTVEGSAISDINELVNVALASNPVDEENLFLYHKTTNRSIYSTFQGDKPAQAFDVLLWNKNHEITEFTNGNIVVEIEGKRYTPPVTSGLLAGTFREILLREEKIFEKVLKVSDLKKATKIWFINSVRKWLEVKWIW